MKGMTVWVELRQGHELFNAEDRVKEKIYIKMSCCQFLSSLGVIIIFSFKGKTDSLRCYFTLHFYPYQRWKRLSYNFS